MYTRSDPEWARSARLVKCRSSGAQAGRIGTRLRGSIHQRARAEQRSCKASRCGSATREEAKTLAHRSRTRGARSPQDGVSGPAVRGLLRPLRRSMSPERHLLHGPPHTRGANPTPQGGGQCQATRLAIEPLMVASWLLQRFTACPVRTLKDRPGACVLQVPPAEADLQI